MGARSIVEEEEAEKALDRCRRKYARFEDFWLAWTWRLARGPEIGALKLSGTNPAMYLIKPQDLSFFGLPAAFSILYSFDEQYVTIYSVNDGSPGAT